MVYRAYDEKGRMLGDILALVEEELPCSDSSLRSTHPQDFSRNRTLQYSKLRPLLTQVMKNGECIKAKESLESKRQRAIEALGTLHREHRQIHHPSEYWVGISEGLLNLRISMGDLEKVPASRNKTG